MNQKAIPVIALACLALMLAVSPNETAFAFSQREASQGITVVPVNGDTVFTSTVLNIEDLAGSQTIGGKIYPVGFAAKEVQFIGNGVRVEGHDYGQASACFAFPTSENGWVGNVYQWNGEKWNKLATTLVNNGENTPVACANFYGSGELALLGGYAGPAEVAQPLPSCIDPGGESVREGYYSVVPIPGIVGEDGGVLVAGYSFYTFNGSGVSPVIVPNIPVEAWIQGASPDDVIVVVQGHGSGISNALGATDVLVKFKQIKEGDFGFTLHVVVDGKCQVDFHWLE
jgi:hypothetical protein